MLMDADVMLAVSAAEEVAPVVSAANEVAPVVSAADEVAPVVSAVDEEVTVMSFGRRRSLGSGAVVEGTGVVRMDAAANATVDGGNGDELADRKEL